ncbi:RHS repeat protein [Acinetobacter pittii]|uniref:RHS repeat-associated core domain-containing protein n=1 Tax=Acinetobacter pittii TaxID=48296 RepID=UPI00136ECC06|nr:RHS repeat-associated core domain-containing protein [Acinetobacter pittii]MZY07138.1 RHS repeat protein [Acinetobacter pittii]
MATNNIKSTSEQKKPAVELAVFNLESITEVTDLQLIAKQIQQYLFVRGKTNLEQLQTHAYIPTVANIFALTGSVLDLLLYITDKNTGDAGTQQTALLGANLIGLFLEPNNQAHARMALRPMLGLMAECLYPENGKMKSTDIKRLGLHLNAMIAGDLEKFLQETLAKLPELLTNATMLGLNILRSLGTPPSADFPITMIGSAGASAEKRDPKLKFTNWAVPLIDLLAAPSQSDDSAKIKVEASSALIQDALKATATLSSALQQQSNAGQKYTLAWLIQESLKAIKEQQKKANASVPANQTGEHEQHTKGDILEFVSLQANALNAAPCTGVDSQTNNSINYSIGAEKVEHIDFSLPKINFSFSRHYHSQRGEFDNGMIGARWMMPFSSVIKQSPKGYIFIDDQGRKHQLPSSIAYQAYAASFENLTVQPLEDGDLILNLGTEWNWQFHSFNEGKDYQLIQQFNGTTQEKVILNYLVVGGSAYLQTVNFQFKKTKHTLKFAFNDQVKIIAIFVDDQVEPLAKYEYDQYGNLIKAYDQNGHNRQYEYNQAHQLIRYTDRTGRGHNIRYDSIEVNAKAIEEWADDGSFHTKLKWHPRLRQVAVYDAYDTPTYYYYDLQGFTYRIRLADGRESWYSRDKYKRITRQIDFNGQEIQQEYNDKGQLIKIVQPNGGVIRFAYNEQGHLIEAKDPEGSIWKWEYDTQGNISKEINPLEQITQYKYNNDNQLIEEIDAKGGSKKIQYNDLGQILSYTDCSGKSSTWEYDENGILQTEQAADKNAAKYQYSTQGKNKGQLQSIIYADGLTEHFEHDEEGRLLKHTDTKGFVTQYQYNSVGLLEKRIDANQSQVSYQWDKQGRLNKLINQNHAEHQFDYNNYGQLVREQAFDGEEKYFSYTENGQLSEIRQPNILSRFSYHVDGQIASIIYTNIETRQSQKQELEYNLNQQLIKASNEVSQIDFYRNALGQVIREHQHYKVPNSVPLTAVLRYEYDELGNLSKTIRPDGQEQTHLSYGSGHVYGVGFNQQDMVAFHRDDLHRETTRMLANGLIQTKNYNTIGLLSSQIVHPESESQIPLQVLKYQTERHYQYDKNYLLTQIKDSRLGQLNYQYDAIGRIIKSQGPEHNDSFYFDPANNLIDSKATQAYELKSNLVAQYQGKNYKYDAQGNVTEVGEAGKMLKLKWDNLNRLVRTDLNGQITEYGYDVFGRRLYKKSSHELTLFGWDEDLMIWESVQYQDNEQNYTKHYVYEPNSFIPLFQTGYRGFIQLIETPDYSKFQTEAYSIHKDPVWRDDSRRNRAELERVSFYHCDQIGTPQALSNELGEPIWEITLNTWGKAFDIKTINESNPFEQSNVRFQGQYYDKESGLHYNRYRYYDPHSSRYISKDPIGLDGGLNTSAYVSNPTQWVDPMGLQPKGGKKPGLGIGFLFPNTMAGFAKDPDDARTLRALGAIRNNNLAAASVAGYGPYAVAGTVAAGSAAAPVVGRLAAPYIGTGAQLEGAGLTAGTVAKAAGTSALVGGGMDAGMQAYTCKCLKDINLVRTGGVAAVSAVTSGWGATTSAAAGFGQVGWKSMALNAPKIGQFLKNNSSGMVIFANEQMIGQTGSRAVKAATEKDKSSKK